MGTMVTLAKSMRRWLGRSTGEMNKNFKTRGTRLPRITWLTAIVLSVLSVGAQATVIRSPIAVVTNTAGECCGPSAGVATTINQSGLSTGFTSGVTDFDAYLAGTPLHSLAFSFNEWFASGFSTSTTGTLVFDLGAVYSVDRMALWNEDGIGFSSVSVFTSLDNVIFTAVSGALPVADNPFNVDYPAEIFSLTTTSAQYVRLDHVGGSLGEIAFSTAGASVPEPTTLSLIVLGVAGIGFARARKRGNAG